VQGKMVSASARSGISGSDRVAQRGFLWVMHEESPILLGLRSPTPPRLAVPPALRLSAAIREACRSILLAREAVLVLFYRTGSYRYSMRGRITDIDRLITRLRGGPHGRHDDDDDREDLKDTP